MKEEKLDKYKKNIQEFANKHKLIFEDEGECGFMRECVGLIAVGGCYVDYNPTGQDYECIKEVYSPELYEIVPEKAYHKHNCMAVLGRDEESIKQLSEWVDKLKELDVAVEEYKTGNTGVQAMFTGTHGYAFKIK